MNEQPAGANLGFRVDTETLIRLDAAADLLGWSRSEVLRRALLVWMDAFESQGIGSSDPLDRIAAAVVGERVAATGDASDDALRRAMVNARRRVRDAYRAAWSGGA